MTCVEFQKALPETMEGGFSGEKEAHLKSCPVCSDLVADLNYIAQQAKLLAPMIDPSPRVWAGIQHSLEREGLVRPMGTRRFPAPVAVLPRRWGAGSLVALAAIVVVAIAIIPFYRSSNRQTAQPAEISNATPATLAAVDVDEDDARLLQAVSESSPRARATYEENLKSVNRYIADARQALQQDPNSEQAHHHLIAASDQKAMLYRMALSRSLQ